MIKFLKIAVAVDVLIKTVGEDIESIRENYDTENLVIAEILKRKAERLKILQELNKQHQEELNATGLLLKSDLKHENRVVKKKRKSKAKFSEKSLRRSTRLQNSSNVVYREYDSYKSEPAKNHIIRPPNDYGPVPGVEVGCHWETRMECSLYGVHRPTVAGIHGGPEGAYSIALSGGYPEDVDEGHSFIYTGAGGRDLKGTLTKPKNLRIAPQTKDQELEGTNLSLVKSIKSKLPVRVIRGYKSPSIFAPETGYRYDGLYQVVEYWEDIGKTGHRIFRFRMERMKEQPPPPWESDSGAKNRERKSFGERSKRAKKDQSDFKENIAPFDRSRSFTDSDKETDVDEEIRICIDFFCKASAITSAKNLKKDCGEDEFHGWDEQ